MTALCPEMFNEGLITMVAIALAGELWQALSPVTF